MNISYLLLVFIVTPTRGINSNTYYSVLPIADFLTISLQAGAALGHNFSLFQIQSSNKPRWYSANSFPTFFPFVPVLIIMRTSTASSDSYFHSFLTCIKYKRRKVWDWLSKYCCFLFRTSGEQMAMCWLIPTIPLCFIVIIQYWLLSKY